MTTAIPAPAWAAAAVHRAAYRRFIDACGTPDGQFRLTPRADASPYALCYAIFGYGLLNAREVISMHREAWDLQLRQALAAETRKRRGGHTSLPDKPYLQLLTFTLSALTALGTLENDPLADTVCPLIPSDIDSALRDAGVLDGAARSGNHAMFLGILLLHARDRLGMDTQPAIERWVQLHLGAMNRFGFWGPDGSMSHLQFQNGYHQYELLEYLHADGVPWLRAANAVASLADPEGHFAPYPGGGGCFDYDAVFVLTASQEAAAHHATLLARTATTLIAEQQADGGFCESLRVRPRSMDNLRRSWAHVRAATGQARRERLRQALTLLRPRHDQMHTHWSRYARGWAESDLWDSWFRMLAIARIECALDPARAVNWGFIDCPGIGFHPSVIAARNQA